MNKIYEYLTNISTTSKRKEKAELLKEYLQDDFFRTVVTAALDKRITYNIKEVPEPMFTLDFDGSSDYTLEKAVNTLNCLSERWVTGNQALTWLSNVLYQLSDEDAEVLRRIVKKDLRCGVGANTINSVMGYEFIYDHPYMSYHSYNEKNMGKVKYPAYIQPKLDGLYFDIVINGSEGTVKYITRNGIELLMPKELTEEILSSKLAENNIVLGGEGLVYNEDMTEFLPRQEGNGVFNSANIKDYLDRIVFVIWDFIPLTDFNNRSCVVPYTERLEYCSLLSSMKYFEFVETHQVDNEGQAREIYNDYLRKGFEGAVIKEISMGWRKGTAQFGVKMKPTFEADLVVVGWNTGENKYASGIGSLICQTSDGLLEVGVAGLTDRQRGVRSIKDEDGSIIGYEAIPDFDKDQYNGKIIVVKYSEIIDNDKDPELYSLFLSRAKKDENGEIEFRIDKDEADTLEKLQNQVG